MTDEIYPARLMPEDVAKRLGFATHDIPVLVAKKLLKPLAKPVASATKYFATSDIRNLANDVSWLNKATQAVYDYWKEKNARKTVNARADANPLPRSKSCHTAPESTSFSE